MCNFQGIERNVMQNRELVFTVLVSYTQLDKGLLFEWIDSLLTNDGKYYKVNL